MKAEVLNFPVDPHANTVDKLGELRAQLKLLQDQVKAYENELKAAAKAEGRGEFLGQWYRVKVSCYEQARVNWKNVAERCHPSHQLVSAHTSHSEVCKLSVSAHRKGG